VAELSLIFGITLTALVAALGLVRWVVARTLPDGVADRLPAAIRSATNRFTQQQAVRGGMCSVLVGVIVWSLASIHFGETLSAHPEPIVNAALPAMGLGLLAGTLLCLLAHQIGAQLGVRFTATVASITQDVAEEPGATALKGGIAITALTEALALACGAGLLLWVRSGAAVESVRGSVGGLALGALVVAMFAQVSGTAIHTAGQVGRRQSRVPGEPFRYQLDARNPSLVLDGSGVQIGVCANRAMDAFCASLLCHLAAVTVALGESEVNFASDQTSALLAATLVVRGVGLIAALGAAALTRSADVDGTTRALWRAHLATTLLSCCGILGASRWLLAGERLVTLCGCAVIGLGVALALVTRSHRAFERRTRRVREPHSSNASLLPVTVSDGASVAVRDAGIPLLVLTSSIGLAWFLGSASGIAFEALLMLAVGFATALPFYGGLQLFDPIVDAACGLASLTPSHARPEFQSRIATLNAAALTAGTAAQSYFITLSGLVGLTLTLAFPASLWPALSGGAPTPGGLAPLTLLAGVFGVATILLYSGLAVRHVAHVTRTCITGLNHEMGQHAGTDAGPVALPSSYRPRYGEWLDQAFAQAFRGVAWYVVGAIVLPVAIIALMRNLGAQPELLAPVLMSFLAFATVTGISVGLVTEGTWSLLSAARRQSRSHDGVQLGALNLAEAIADFAGNTVSPTAQLIVKGVIAGCLAAGPILL
jgi:Inorganic H+ pyrophosphatase